MLEITLTERSPQKKRKERVNKPFTAYYIQFEYPIGVWVAVKNSSLYLFDMDALNSLSVNIVYSKPGKKSESPYGTEVPHDWQESLLAEYKSDVSEHWCKLKPNMKVLGRVNKLNEFEIEKIYTDEL